MQIALIVKYPATTYALKMRELRILLKEKYLSSELSWGKKISPFSV